MKTFKSQSFTSERERLETFNNWPRVHTATPYEFVQAGFYYSGNSDKVICIFCNGELSNWGPSDNPMEQHRLHFPECIFVHQYIRSPHNFIQSGASTAHSNVRPFIQRSTVNISAPHHPNPSEANCQPSTSSNHMSKSPRDYTCCNAESPDYTVERVRLQSFRNWPLEYPDVVELARAGFYYMGAYDLMKCFACGGLVKSWNRDDDPWIEHAKFFPGCKYLHMCLGEDVAKEIHTARARNLPTEYIDACVH